jgi:purine-binding chemotaxis protein CheW
VNVTVDGRSWLVRLGDIREIVSLMALAEPPGRAGLCRGVANLRGEMIPVFDLGGAEAKLAPSRVILVARAGADIVGLIVDDVHNVVDVSDEDLAVRPVGGGRFATMVRVDDEILSVMEIEDALRDEL